MTEPRKTESSVPPMDTEEVEEQERAHTESKAIVKTPLSATWKVRTNEIAVDDFLRERRAGADFKGRSLLQAFDHQLRLGDQYHVWEHKSSSSTSSSVSVSPVCCCECTRCLCRSLTCENVEERKSVGGEKKRWWKGCVATCLVLFGVMSVVSFGEYGDENVGLVPT